MTIEVLIGLLIGGCITFLFQKVFHLENVVPHELKMLHHEIKSYRAHMIEEVILNRQLDAYHRIQVFASNLVRESIDKVNGILQSNSRVLNEETKQLEERMEKLREVVDGYQFIIPQSLNIIMERFMHSADDLIKAIQNPPPEDLSFEEYQALRKSLLDNLKNIYPQIGFHLKEMHAPILDNLVYEFPNDDDLRLLDEKRQE